MIIRVVFEECTEKIMAIKFIRALTGMGLKDAKDLMDALDVNRTAAVPSRLKGEYRFRVNAEKTLSRLLPQLNSSYGDMKHRALPEGMNLYVEPCDIIDCTQN